MSDNGLTARQSRFAALVVEGHGLSDAYRRSYSTDNMSDASIHSEASRLRHDPKISPIIEAGISEAMGDAVWSRKRAITRLLELNDRALSEIEDGNVTPTVVTAFTSSLDRLNRLHGTDKTQSDGDEQWAEMVSGLTANLFS